MYSIRYVGWMCLDLLWNQSDVSVCWWAQVTFSLKFIAYPSCLSVLGWRRASVADPTQRDTLTITPTVHAEVPVNPTCLWTVAERTQEGAGRTWRLHTVRPRDSNPQALWYFNTYSIKEFIFRLVNDTIDRLRFESFVYLFWFINDTFSDLFHGHLVLYWTNMDFLIYLSLTLITGCASVCALFMRLQAE